MQNLMSDYKKFKCSCQKDFILSQQLIAHLKKPSIHLIKLLKTKPKKQKNKKIKKKAKERYNLIKSSNIDSYFTFLINNLIHYYFKNFSNIHSPKKTYLKLSLQINKILQKPLIKEITIFKYKKQQIKIKFNHFLKNKIGQPLIFRLSKHILISGGRDGKVRLFNPENLQQKACLSYHQAPIYSLDISGNYGLSGSNDRSICLWNIKKYKIKNIFKGHQEAIISLKFIKNSRLFVSGSYDQTARIWNYSKNSLLFIILFNSSLIYLCISHQKFIFVCEDGKIQQMSRSKFLSRTNLRARVFCSKLAEEIEVLVTGHEDGWIQFINSKSFCLFDRFRGHTSSVISIGFCKYSKIFASCSNDCSIKLWSSKPFKLLKVFKNLEYPTCCVEILKDVIYLGNLQIEKLDIQTRRTINKANLSSYLCFSVSIQLNLIVYGLDVVCLMSLKSLKYVNSKPVNCKIIYLCFFKSIIVCGLHTGHILYLDCPSLMIKRRYLLTRLPIYSIVPSSDLNVLVYSTFNKTSFVDLKSMKSLMSHNNRIISGKFALSMFVFIDDLCTLYIVKNFEKCRKISYTQPGSQLFLFKSNKYIIIKEFSSEVTLINLEKPENYERLYCLKELVKKKDKRDFYMKRSDLILSSLNTYMLLS